MQLRAIATHTIEQNEYIAPPPYLTLSEEAHTCDSAYAGSRTIVVSSNVEWSVELLAGDNFWLSVTPFAGSAGDIIVLVAWEPINFSIVTKIRFVSPVGGVSADYVLVREYTEVPPIVPDISVDMLTIEDVPQEGSIYEINVKSNVPWYSVATCYDVSGNQLAESWILTEDIVGETQYNGTIVVTVDASRIGNRSGIIYIVYDENTENPLYLEIPVSQVAANYLYLTQGGTEIETINVDDNAGSIQILVNCDSWWHLNNLETLPDGIDSITIASGGELVADVFGNRFVTIYYKQNPLAETPRTIELTFERNDTPEFYATLSIYQAADFIVVNNGVLDICVPYDEHTREIELNTLNVWEVVCADTWIVPQVDSGTGSATLLFDVSAKPDEKIRRTTITISSPDNKFDDIVIAVRQVGMPSGIVQGENDYIWILLYCEFDPSVPRQSIPTLPVFDGSDCESAQFYYDNYAKYLYHTYDSWLSHLNDTDLYAGAYYRDPTSPFPYDIVYDLESVENIARLYFGGQHNVRIQHLGLTTDEFGVQTMHPYVLKTVEDGGYGYLPGEFQSIAPTPGYKRMWAESGEEWLAVNGAEPPNNTNGIDYVPSSDVLEGANAKCTNVIKEMFASDYFETWGDPYLKYNKTAESQLNHIIIVTPKLHHPAAYYNCFGRQYATLMGIGTGAKVFNEPITRCIWQDELNTYGFIQYPYLSLATATSGGRTLLHEYIHCLDNSKHVTMLGAKRLPWSVPDIYYESLSASGPPAPQPIGSMPTWQSDRVMATATPHNINPFVAGTFGLTTFSRYITAEGYYDLTDRQYSETESDFDHIVIASPVAGEEDCYCVLWCWHPKMYINHGAYPQGNRIYRGVYANFAKLKTYVPPLATYTCFNKPITHYTNFDMIEACGYSSINNGILLNKPFQTNNPIYALKRQARLIDLTLGMGALETDPSSITDNPFGISVEWIGWIDADGNVMTSNNSWAYYDEHPTVVPRARIYVKFEVTTTGGPI